MKRDLNLDFLKRVGRFAVYLSIWGLVSASAIAKKNARVLVDFYARDEYEESKVVDGEARYETYHFSKCGILAEIFVILV